MKRLSIALPALAGLALGASFSPLAAQEAVNWTGPYLGAHLGYAVGEEEDARTTGQAVPNVNNVVGGARPANVSMDTEGTVGGIAAGYNMQSGNLVYGLEADLDYTDIDDSRRVVTRSLPTATPPNTALNNNFHQSLEYMGTVRARLGFLVQPTTLLYATGGLAYGSIDNSVKMFGAANQLQFSDKSSNMEYGYAVGAGVEHMIDAPWSLTASYLYYDLGSDTLNVAVVPGSGGAGTGYNTKFETAGHMMRVGIGYKF